MAYNNPLQLLYKTKLSLCNNNNQRFLWQSGKDCHLYNNLFSEEFLDLTSYINAPAEEAEWYMIKEREEMGVKYMQDWEEKVYDRMEAREEGERIGQIRAMVNIIRNAMEKLVSLEKDCELADITIENYMEYSKMYFAKK